MQRPLHMRIGVGERPRHMQTRVMSRAGGVAVRSPREFDRDHRATLRHPQQMAEVIAPRLALQHLRRHFQPRRAQKRVAAPGDARVGIVHRRHNARDAAGDDGVDAGRRLAVMRAGLERYVNRRAARRVARRRQRQRFGVRAAACSRKAAPDDDAAPHDERADSGIRRGAAEIAPSQRQRRAHIVRVVISFAHAP